MTLTCQQIDETLAKHEPMIRWVARRVMGHNARYEDIEDCAAEVRLQFVKAAQRYDPSRGTAFSTYALRLARFAALRFRRHQRYRGVHMPEYVSEQDGIRVIDLGDDYALASKTQGVEIQLSEPATIWATIAKHLTTKQLEVLRMRYLDEMTYREIADRCGCSRAAIQQRLATAISRVRRLARKLAEG